MEYSTGQSALSLTQAETQRLYAAAENFSRLQEAQSDFLQWLEVSEKTQANLDRYAYRTIR